MKIGVPKERRAGERRVAATPVSVKKLIALGAEVAVEAGAGATAAIPDADYAAAGATMVAEAAQAFDADIVLKVRAPMTAAEGDDEMALLRQGSLLIGVLAAMTSPGLAKEIAARKVTAMSLELLPRITRAQGMDVLSSQSNLSGYRAVIDAVHEFGRAMPMMMTAAGTITPARVLILGAGVAGLQAIATARRLGAVVSAFDVRPVAKEQVESLGASFIEVASEESATAETAGGYAREMGEDYQRLQTELIHDTLKSQDIAITTALIPGRPAPVLITEDMVKDMKPGSVIVDLAVEAGGNCPLSEIDRIVEVHGVKIIGYGNVPSRLAADTSALYANNLVNFISPLIGAESKQLEIDWEDEIIAATCITSDGEIVLPALKEGDN